MKALNEITTAEMVGILNISRQSAWRKITGLSPLKLNEAQKLAEHYNISLSTVMEIFSYVRNGGKENGTD